MIHSQGSDSKPSMEIPRVKTCIPLSENRLNHNHDPLELHSYHHHNLFQLLKAFYLGGGRIDNFKTVKFIANILSHNQNPYLNYTWYRNYFGEYSTCLTNDLNILITEQFLEWTTVRANKQSPLHNIFTLSEKGYERVIHAIENEFISNKHYINSITSQILTCNILPSELCLFLACDAMGDIQEDRTPFNLSYLDFEDRVSINLVDNYYNWLRTNTIVDTISKKEVSLSDKRGDKVIIINLKLKPSSVKQRYSYLKINDSSIRQLTEILNGLKSNPGEFIKQSLTPRYFNKIHNQTQVHNHMIKKIVSVQDRLAEISDMNIYWKRIIGKIEAIYRIVSQNNIQFRFFVEDGIIALHIPTELQKYIKESGGLGTFNVLWHSLQPQEYLFNNNNKYLLRRSKEAII